MKIKPVDHDNFRAKIMREIDEKIPGNFNERMRMREFVLGGRIGDTWVPAGVAPYHETIF